jgi:hypothetical protein
MLENSTSCVQCGTQNPPSYAFCSGCGTSLNLQTGVEENAAPGSRRRASKLSTKRRISFAATAGVLILGAYVITTKLHSPVDGDRSSPQPAMSADAIDPQVQTLAKVKKLWRQGAEAKKKRHFADAAVAWKEALELKPKHPGIQQAIDKLPVEVSYSVDSAFGQGGERCEISYLNERQKRVRLKNVSLPWYKKFIVPRGQPLSVTAASASRQSPSVASILIGSVAVAIADSPKLWWLGYASKQFCSVKATYGLPSAYPPTDSGSWYSTAGDPALFMEKVRDVFGEKTDLLIEGAGTIRDTDILMVTLTSNWERVSSDVRLEVAQDIYRAWNDIHTPTSGKQVYILMIGEDNQRLGGSRYPNGSQLWVINQGQTGEIIAVPAKGENYMPSLDGGSLADGDSSLGGDSSSSEQRDTSSSSSSDIGSFRLQISDAPSMERFVSGIEYLAGSTDTVKIFVTDEFNGLDQHLRLQLAQKLLQIWQSTHAPRDPNRARIILKAGDGTTVGGQQMMGKVWVAD